MDWYTCSKTFVKVVDEKGFAPAARKLYTTQSSISKRIAWLENMLDTQLLTRTTRRLDLTEAGEKYYNHVIPLIDEWEELKQDVATSTKLTTGELKIAVPTIAGNHYISQLIPNFLMQYPDIKLIMLLTSKTTNLIEDQIDIYISSEDLGKSAANTSQQITGPCRKLYASPSYLAENGEPKSLKALQKHNCLVHTAHVDNCWKFKNRRIPVYGNFRSNNADMLIKAAVSGLGIIFVPESFVQEELQNNALKELMPQHHSDNIYIYASYPAHNYIPKKTQVFIEFLKNQLNPPEN